MRVCIMRVHERGTIEITRVLQQVQSLHTQSLLLRFRKVSSAVECQVSCFECSVAVILEACVTRGMGGHGVHGAGPRLLQVNKDFRSNDAAHGAPLRAVVVAHDAEAVPVCV